MQNDDERTKKRASNRLGERYVSQSLKETRKVRSRHLAVLKVLADEGPLNKYGICKELVPSEASEPTILYRIDNMEQQGLVRVVKTIKKVRGSKPSKYYDVSLAGLLLLVRPEGRERDKNKIELARRLAAKYADLMPHILDLWPAFREAGVEDEALDRLQFWGAFEEGLPEKLEEGSQLHKEALSYILTPMRKSEKWCKAIRTNDQLRKVSIPAVRGEIEALLRKRDEIDKQIEDMKEFLKSLQDLEG
jgi:DNA-binding PadR family transcriptional regulator